MKNLLVISVLIALAISCKKDKEVPPIPNSQVPDKISIDSVRVYYGTTHYYKKQDSPTGIVYKIDSIYTDTIKAYLSPDSAIFHFHIDGPTQFKCRNTGKYTYYGDRGQFKTAGEKNDSLYATYIFNHRYTYFQVDFKGRITKK